MKGKSMRKRKVKEQMISIIALFSVFIFFIYLKMNPEISTTSLSSEIISTETESVVKIEDNIENIKDHSSITNTAELEISKSIVKYTESELKRAEAYFNRNWKPDHTINIAAWDYISKMAIIEDEKVLKEIFDMKENQVVNALK